MIRDFCVEYLDEDPASLFGQEAWNVFLEADEIYQKEKAVCTQSLSQIDWTYSVLKEGLTAMRCPSCQSDLIMADGDKRYAPGKSMLLLCKKCQHGFDFEDVIEECVHEGLYVENFIAIKDGGECPYDTCPECTKDTYVFDEGACLACGYGHEEVRCAVCDTPLDLEEAYEGSLCSYHRWQAEKDD